MTKIFEFGLKNAVASSFPPLHYLKGKAVNNKIMLNAKFADVLIAEAVESGKPTLVGRLGGTEARALGCYLDTKKFKSLIDPISTSYSLMSRNKRKGQLMNLSGVYPNTSDSFEKFAKIYENCLRETDILGAWGKTFTWPEALVLDQTHTSLVPLVTTSPWVDPYPTSNLESVPWSNKLEGKRVLIVSAFSTTFKSQLARINEIFPGKSFPTFDAIFVNAPMSLGGESEGSWEENLLATKRILRGKTFDVALISAGAYSYPLAMYAKELGKVGIHAGGELQLFFGVIGKRWEQYFKYKNYENEFWVRPTINERPSNWKDIENGCYW